MLTRYQEKRNPADPLGPVSAGCETLGEFANSRQAAEAKAAFEAKEVAAKRIDKFVIVQQGFELATMAYYAYSFAEAELTKGTAEQQYGGEWRIYRQESE